MPLSDVFCIYLFIGGLLLLALPGVCLKRLYWGRSLPRDLSYNLLYMYCPMYCTCTCNLQVGVSLLLFAQSLLCMLLTGVSCTRFHTVLPSIRFTDPSEQHLRRSAIPLKPVLLILRGLVVVIMVEVVVGASWGTPTLGLKKEKP